MKSFSFEQRRVLADFFGNIAVGWFIGGVIATFMTRPEALNEIYTRFGWGMLMSYVFLRLALSITEEK